jgi:hypothetical protein
MVRMFLYMLLTMDFVTNTRCRLGGHRGRESIDCIL